MVENIKSLLEENEDLKKETKKQNELSGKIDMSSDESGNDSVPNTEESAYLPTS